MTKRHLEDSVRQRYGMDMHTFLRKKIEEDSLYDYEIAAMLNVRPSLIGRMRSSIGVKRSNGFSRRFERTYGRGAVETFKKMIEDPDKSLSDVGRRFGFSRQNAWLVSRKIYGYPYTKIFMKKILTKKQKAA